MNGRLSDDLITISTMMMVAKERRDFINLAGEMNAAIQKAIEIENTGTTPEENRKTLSATIKFTKQEIDKMSKTFKKEFIANGCVSHIIKRPSGKNGFYYEIRYRRNNYDISVSNKDVNTAKRLFIEATKNLESPALRRKNRLKLKAILEEWIEFKKDQISVKTCNDHKSLADRYIIKELGDLYITDIHTSDIKRIMPKFSDDPRKYEELRSILNQTFNYAIDSGIITHNPVKLIPFKKATRANRDALTNKQLHAFIQNIKDPKFDKIRQGAYVLYFFGLRPCELDREAHFENGFLICRNRKRKDGKIEYKKIPIPKQAQGLIEFDKPITFSLSYTKSLDIFKEIFEVNNKITFYNLRHTFASLCAKSVREDIVEVWMGDIGYITLGVGLFLSSRHRLLDTISS